MIDALTTIAELLGAVAIVIGCALISIPLALIVGGVLAILASYLVADR
jgi:hypothetical protein